VTSSELAKEVFAVVKAKVLRTASPIEFEMAYQVRIAIEHIRFAIREVEKRMPSQHLCEVSLQLADALDRLESADRHFQERFHSRPRLVTGESGSNQNRKSVHNGVGQNFDSHR
jgi:hypothetical protein